MDTKKDLYICSLQETHFIPNDTYRLKVRECKNIFHANRKQKKAGVAILISDKIDLKIKKIIRDKEGHYIMIKGSVHEEDITIVIIHSSILDTYLRNPRDNGAWQAIVHSIKNSQTRLSD